MLTSLFFGRQKTCLAAPMMSQPVTNTRFLLAPTSWLLQTIIFITSDAKDNSRRIILPGNITYLNLTKSDAQVIQCNASNGHGYLFTNAYLNVLGKFVAHFSQL
jgi:hypothetical protein